MLPAFMIPHLTVFLSQGFSNDCYFRCFRGEARRKMRFKAMQRKEEHLMAKCLFNTPSAELFVVEKLFSLAPYPRKKCNQYAQNNVRPRTIMTVIT